MAAAVEPSLTSTLHCDGCSLDAADPVSQACCTSTMAEGGGAGECADKPGIVETKRKKLESEELSTCGKREDGQPPLGLHLKLVQELEGHTDRVWGLAWSPGGSEGSKSLLASCSGDKTVRVWQHSAASPSVAGSWFCDSVLQGTQTRTVRSCDWSPGAKLLATASFDATTAIWENVGAEFECVASLEGHEHEVKSVSWNAQGTLLATCSRDKSVWIWEVQPGNDFECVSVLTGHIQDVKMVLWHPARDLLVSASYDNTIKIWAEDGGDDDWGCVQTIGEPGIGHSSTVWAVSFSGSGDRMVSCSDDLSIMVWDSSTDPSQSTGVGFGPWKHLTTITGYHNRTIFSVHCSSLHSIIASGSGDDSIQGFAEDTSSPSERPSYTLVLKHDKAHLSDINCVRWHPTDPRLLASSSDDGTVRIWQVCGDISPYLRVAEEK